MILALLLLLLPVARAQAPEDELYEEDEDAGQALPEAPLPAMTEIAPLENGIGARFVWEHRGRFKQRGAVTGLAVSALDRDGVRAWLAVDEAGWAWRSTDEGATWVLVLRGEDLVTDPDEERVLLDAEVLRDESLGSVETTDGETPDLDALRNDISAANQLAGRDGVRGSLLEDGATAEPRAWFHPTDPNVVLIGRADGTWRSEDGGLDWTLVDDVVSTSFYADGDTVVAGTTSGVRWSLDGGAAWIDVEDITDGSVVRGLGRAGSWIYAATSRGLFRSRDGLSWQSANTLRSQPLVDVVPDPNWPGGAWVATRKGLLRTDDDGRTFYEVDRGLVQDLRRLVTLPGTSHLLALTADGPWESTDGGVRWIPAQMLLRDPDVREVAVVNGWPVLAARSGIYRLTSPVELAERPRSLPMPPIGEMVRLAQGREGLRTDLLALSRLRLMASAAPQVDVTFNWDSVRARTADFRDLANTEAQDGGWSAVARACWGACTASSQAVVYDPTDTSLLDDAALYVVGGEVFDENDALAAAANAAQSIRAYRQAVASTVVEAWTARQRLNQEQAIVDLQSLRDQVVHAIAIAEADARLDLYTEGAFSQALLALQAKPQEPR